MTIFQNLNQIPLLVGNFFSQYALVGLFLAVFLLGLFITWYEGRREGFDEDKLFDLSFLSSIVSLIVIGTLLYILNFTRIYHPRFFLLYFDGLSLLMFAAYTMSLLPVHWLSKRWHWSKYRILDIYSTSWFYVSVLLGVVFYLLFGRYDFLFFSIYLLSVLLVTLVTVKFHIYVSGMKFAFFTIAYGVGFLFTLSPIYNLIFFGILSTISVVTLHSRYKKTMVQTRFSKEFLKKAFASLRRKEKELTDAELLLKKEDPDRGIKDSLESESMDAANAENEKENTMAELSVLRKMKVQVNRALAALKLGKYGICEMCGGKIEQGRLSVYPEATTCMKCASKQS